MCMLFYVTSRRFAFETLRIGWEKEIKNSDKHKQVYDEEGKNYYF